VAPLGPSLEAWVSAVGGRGDRLAWLAREQASGRLLVLFTEINEPAGLRELRLSEVTRKELRSMRQRLQAEAGLTLVPADWRAVDALVLEAQDRLETPERRLDYRRLRAQLTTAAPLPPAELVSTHVAAPDAGERDRLLPTSGSLVSEPELRTWWPRREQSAPLLEEIRAIRESPLVLAPAQQDERLRAVLVRAANELYPAASFARRLEATAFVFAETARPEAARVALAAAAALRAGVAPADVPLIQALVQRGLGSQLAAAEAERRATRAGALVLTPEEVATRGSPSRPRPPRT
jgi:hypothetical protein